MKQPIALTIILVLLLAPLVGAQERLGTSSAPPVSVASPDVPPIPTTGARDPATGTDDSGRSEVAQAFIEPELLGYVTLFQDSNSSSIARRFAVFASDPSCSSQGQVYFKRTSASTGIPRYCIATGAPGTWQNFGSGTVTSVSGTANQIVVTNPTTTPLLSLSPNLILPGSLSSAAGDPADSGIIRLGNAELIEWEKFATGADWTLGVNASDQLESTAQFKAPSLVVGGGTTINTPTTVGVNLLQATNPSAISFPKVAADNTVSFRTPAQVLSDIGAQATGNYITALTGDGTASGPGSVGLTLATVNSNVGTFGSATQSLTATVNGKGLITALSAQTVTPAVGSITGLGANVATFLGTPSSANFLAAVSDETGSGLAMGNNTPTIITPTIASFVNANHDHTNAAGGGQLNATSIFSAGTVPTARLGSGTANSSSFLRGDQTWQAVTVPTAANPTASLGLSAINGSASTFMRSDAAPALDVTIAPTWPGQHKFSLNGAASTPPVSITGTWFVSGTSTTTKPQFLVEPSGTSSTNWSATGTGIGVNAPSGFSGNLLDLNIAGSNPTIFKVDSGGGVRINGQISISTSNVGFGNTGILSWNGNSDGSGKDTSMCRDAAGRVSFNTTACGTFGDTKARQYFIDSTITAAGTTGAQTINKAGGTVNFAAAATSLVVTDSLVTTSSLITGFLRTNDATCRLANIVPASGSFTINMTGACTAETSVGFVVH